MKRFITLVLLIAVTLGAQSQLLWKISGNGLQQPSYIFGTYHLSPLSIKDSIASLPQAMQDIRQVSGTYDKEGRSRLHDGRHLFHPGLVAVVQQFPRSSWTLPSSKKPRSKARRWADWKQHSRKWIFSSINRSAVKPKTSTAL